MITDEEHPWMQIAAKDLGDRLLRFLGGRPLITARLLQEADQLIYDFRVRQRVRGVDFPPMVALCAPRVGAIAFYRGDLDLVGIRGAVVAFARSYTDLRPKEIAWAVQRAWPHVKPGDLVDESRHIISVDAARMN